MAKNDKTVKRGVYLYIDGKEIKNDINSIDLEMKRLQRDIKEMTRGSEEYNRTMAKIQHLQGILKQHRQEIKGITAETKKATVSIGSMVDWFNRFGGVILSVIGFLTGFTLALRAIRDERNKLEESQAGLKALTGLDDDSIAWLTGQAKTLSTTMTKEGLRVRQSAAEILDAFMLVGSAKPELLGDKEALKAVTEEAMRLQAAAKDITLNEAVDSLTLSLNQYGAAADQAGRFTNVLAAGSQAGSANIASQAKAIRNAGTAAASANVPIEQTVALIETLAYRGIKDEVAGTGLKKFFLVLQTGADETNPKIVGLDKALENLKNKNMDAGAIKKMFGEEGYNTTSVILQNTEMVKDFTAAVTGTNVAYEQAAINSDTAQAKLEQARNKMKLAAIDLGEKLNPALTVSTNMLTNVLKYLPGLIDWCNKWGGTVLYVASCIAVYTLRTKAATIASKAWNAITKTATALQLAYGIAVNTVSGYTVTSFTQLRRLSTLLAGHNILLKTVRVSTYLFAGAMQVLQGRVDLAAKSMRAAWTVMKLSPAGALSTVLLAGGAAFLYLYKRAHEYVDVQKATNRLQKEAAKSTADQRKELDTLWMVAQNNRVAMDKRREAMEKINKIAPDYLGDITLETINTQKAADAKARYVEQLQKEAMLKGASSYIESESKKLIEYQVELDKALAGQKKARESATYAQTGFTAYDAAVEQLKFNIEHTKKAIESYMTIYEQISKELEVSTKTNSGTDGNSGGNGGGNGGKCPICGNKPCTCDKNNTTKDKFVQAEADYYRRIADIKRKYLADDKMTQEEYNKQMRDAEMQLLNDKLKVKGLEPSEIQRINDQILDAEIKARDELRRLDEQSAKDEEKRRKEQAEETFSRLDKEYQMQVEAAAMYHYENKTSEEEYFNELRRLQDVYYHKVLNDAAISEEKKNQVREQMRKRNLKDAQKDAEEEKRIERERFDILSDLAKGFGETMAQFFTDSEVSLKDFLKNILTMSLDALERMMIMAVTERTIKNIGSLGFVGVAKAAGEIALITAAFETAKGLISNFYTGGFTPSGDWDQPQGIVHSNEFVANRFAVANPNLRPIFDAIDVAQRSGNVGNLTAEDIAAVAGPGKSTRTVPAKAPAASATTTTNDPAMVAMLIECTRVLRKLKNRLDAPLVAETYVTGKRGINQAQKEYQKLNNNKSRNKQ
ncbi:phage tail tape measure protein [Bacteroides sp. KH569_7]|uniref:Phage tail tape measure protein n=1 Tax=Bacteroides muris (ex Fokt et al. 2023) TaxID=2937417 RepID=A0A9X2NXY2_9BACE|nr:phage tail tape measure protein [Bacteroides muris (ex Fokt et al. 2023)]MCR6507670.1 phage tail tape measure protein [Bacteroides muris (ex Fokt et al. 2023)]